MTMINNLDIEYTDFTEEPLQNASEGSQESQWSQPVQKHYTGQQRLFKSPVRGLTLQQEVYIINPNIKYLNGQPLEFLDWENVEVN